MQNVSVIIPYSGRIALLKQVIEPLLKQIKENDEVLVVNDSCDNSVAFFTQDLNIKVIDLININKSNNNLVLARNKGVLESSNNFIIFLDGDCVPCNRLVDIYRQDLENYDTVHGYVEWLEKDGTHKPDYRVSLDEIRFRKGLMLSMPVEVNSLSNIGQGGGGNFAIRKELFNSVGGFSEEFNGGFGHEDIDLLRKIQRKGKDIYYDIRACVVHQHHIRNLKGLSRNTELFKKKWNIK